MNALYLRTTPKSARPRVEYTLRLTWLLTKEKFTETR